MRIIFLRGAFWLISDLIWGANYSFWGTFCFFCHRTQKKQGFYLTIKKKRQYNGQRCQTPGPESFGHRCASTQPIGKRAPSVGWVELWQGLLLSGSVFDTCDDVWDERRAGAIEYLSVWVSYWTLCGVILYWDHSGRRTECHPKITQPYAYCIMWPKKTKVRSTN